MQKKVSIIIPVYNVEKYLQKCLESVCSQTYNNLEIILIDDGSKDLSGVICDKFANIDERIIVWHQENAGAAIAKNQGLDKATGDYITFVDSDDYVEADWIEKMVSTLEVYSADVVECNFDKVYVDTVEPGNDLQFQEKIFTTEEYMEQYLNVWTSSLFWNKLFRRKLTEKVRFKNERRCIDDEFYTYKIVSQGKKVVRIADVLYHYRQRKSSAVYSQQNQRKKAEDALDVLIERYLWVKNLFPKLQSIYMCHDVDILFFLAAEFPFSERAITTFRKTVRFYFKESLKYFPGMLCMKNIIKAFLISKEQLERSPQMKEVYNKECFE